MKTSEILQLDCRKEENQEVIQRVLRKIKPLANCLDEQIPMYKLEKCAQVLCRKYDFVMSMYADAESNRSYIIWRCTINRYGQSVISGTNVFGCSVYEAVAKSVIAMYSYARRQNG